MPHLIKNFVPFAFTPFHTNKNHIVEVLQLTQFKLSLNYPQSSSIKFLSHSVMVRKKISNFFCWQLPNSARKEKKFTKYIFLNPGGIPGFLISGSRIPGL